MVLVDDHRVLGLKFGIDKSSNKVGSSIGVEDRRMGVWVYEVQLGGPHDR